MIQGERFIFEGMIRDQTWIELGSRPGAVVLMNSETHAQFNKAVANRLKGSPLAQ